MPVLALAVTTVAVIASVVIPRLDRTGSRPTDPARTSPGVTFTVIDDPDPSPTPSPSPSAPPRSVRTVETAVDTEAPTRRVGPRRVSVQSGEVEEESTDQDLEEEEEERKLEEEEERAKAREERRNRDDD